MLNKKVGFKPHEVQIGRHYWFTYSFEDINVDCVIKVLNLTGNVVEGRALDTLSLVFFFSKQASFEEDPDEIKEEFEEFEVLVEHLTREVSCDELKTLIDLVERSTQDFFRVEPLIERRLLN